MLPGSSTSGALREEQTHLAAAGESPCARAVPTSSLLPQKSEAEQGRGDFSCCFICQRQGVEPKHLLLLPKAVRIPREATSRGQSRRQR